MRDAKLRKIIQSKHTRERYIHRYLNNEDSKGKELIMSQRHQESVLRGEGICVQSQRVFVFQGVGSEVEKTIIQRCSLSKVVDM